MRFLLSSIAVSLIAASAQGSGGVVEINHACALAQNGCGPGDGPGYPVQITQPGSYRLTSNLQVPANVDGVQLADFASLDLNGFEIVGPVSCPFGCPSPSAGNGIFGNSQITVTNGRVRGFGLDCIQLTSRAQVSRVQVSSCARHGANVGPASFVAENQIGDVGQSAIAFGTAAVGHAAGLYRDNTIGLTGSASVTNGRASGPNTCFDQKCGSGAALFYLTTTTHNGANADAACAVGFHLASFWEIADPSGLEYDTSRGFVRADSGQGPPAMEDGWVRTGQASSTLGTGAANCNAWSTIVVDTYGSQVRLTDSWSASLPGEFDAIWIAGSKFCSSVARAWCVQD